MPMYPALALLIGSAMNDTANEKWLTSATKILGGTYAAAFSIIAVILYAVQNVSAVGDISAGLERHPSGYTLSLGHMGDLTLRSFAYLRGPLALAGLACLVGVVGSWSLPTRRAIFAIAASMVIFFQASRLALVVFDPYLSSWPLAERLLQQADGRLIIDGPYYPFSSLLYYSRQDALLLNGRSNNLEYGSYAPGTPAVFIDDRQFAQLWPANSRYYLASDGTDLERLRKLAGSRNLYQVAESGGKLLFTNHPLESGRSSVKESPGRAW